MTVGLGRAAPAPTPSHEPPSIAGGWTYRSFNNEPDPEGDLYWWVADITLEQDDSGILTGALAGITSQEAFNLVGYIDHATLLTDREWWQQRFILVMRAVGATSETAGHQYDYRGYVPGVWPTGKEQVPAIVGSVLRAKFPDDPSLEGEVRSFAAVRRSGGGLEVPPRQVEEAAWHRATT